VRRSQQEPRACDGAGSTIALSWSNAPAGTREFALMMTTLSGDGTTTWNWVLYGIPATTTGVAKNSSGVGTLGVGSDGPQAAYQPPCSQGPGAKLCTFTLHALSASPTLPVAASQDEEARQGSLLAFRAAGQLNPRYRTAPSRVPGGPAGPDPAATTPMRRAR